MSKLLLEDASKFEYDILVPTHAFLSNDNSGMEFHFVEGCALDKEYSDFIEFELYEADSKANKQDYAIAVSSGLLSGALSVFWSKELSLENAKSWGDKEANDFVIKVAQAFGYNKPNLEGDDLLYGAIKHLEKKFPILGDKLMADFGGGFQHHLRDFSHHPSVVGLICSILMQFTGKGFGADTDGCFIRPPLADADKADGSFVIKIFNGTILWAMHLISDMAGSSDFPGAGTGIPGPLLSLLKEASALPFFKNLKVNYKDDEIALSKWISKCFNGTAYRTEDGKNIRFDLRAEMGFAGLLMDQAKPVLINECIIRSFYFISRLYLEFKDNDVNTIKDLKKIDPGKFLPYNNRALARMITVSSGTFEVVNIAGAAVKAAVKNKGLNSASLKSFMLNINYVGVVRFVVACEADAEYIGDDIKGMYRNYENHKQELREREQYIPEFKFLQLNEGQVRILYSLEAFKVEYDISHTDEKKRKAKLQWLKEWKEHILASMQSEDKEFFILDKELAYDCLRFEATESNHTTWLNLVALELLRFKPYYPLGSERDADYKGLRCSNKYEKDVFSKMQSLISEKELDDLTKIYQDYNGKLTNTGTKVAIGAVGTAAFVAASGGLALAFAPQIAAVIAGEAVAGLSGAALASASLAFVGGGALAAGGLGMAGGTAILTGGGILVGLAGSGAASAASFLGQISEKYTLNECCKLLTICKCVIVGKYNLQKELLYIQMAIEKLVEDLDEEIRRSTEHKEPSKKIKNMKSSQKYLKRCCNELEKMGRRSEKVCQSTEESRETLETSVGMFCSGKKMIR